MHHLGILRLGHVGTRMKALCSLSSYHLIEQGLRTIPEAVSDTMKSLHNTYQDDIPHPLECSIRTL